MTVDAIKEAIAQLPEYERHSLAAWVNELDYDAWDRQMAADFSPGGRGMMLVERVEREVVQGTAVPFQQGMEQAKSRPRR
ncbi:MAG TPA: hypothetical protein VF283_12085 [Bryobacteraceae bacterium]